MDQLPERWRAQVPGDAAHCIHCHLETRSVFIGDGWSVPYPALSLHRLSLDTGTELASARTRHQGVGALAVVGKLLYAATDSRLFELIPETLEVRRQWDRNLVRYTQQLASTGNLLVGANWLQKSIGLFDPASGRTRRLQAGLQPILVEHPEGVMVVAGFEGGVYRLDAVAERLVPRERTPPIWRVASGDEIWAVAAGPRTGGQGKPPVWWRPATDRLLKVGDSEWGARLPGPCSALACDDRRGMLWCLLGPPHQHGNAAGSLVAVSQGDGSVIRRLSPPEGSFFIHVDAMSNSALAIEPHPEFKGNVKTGATALLICLELGGR